MASTVEQLAGMLRERAVQLEQAAVAGRWSGVTQALGAITGTCAGCHEAVRWREGHAH
jgi:cytochrome c556